MKAVALTCARCSGRLLAAPRVPLGVCNPCSTAWDFSAGEKRALAVEEALVDPPEAGEEILRLPFIRFDAEGAGSSGSIYVMAFAISKIGTPYDDGSKLTIEAKKFDTRPGGVDRPPELSIETASGLARFLALRRLDPDGRASLHAKQVAVKGASLLSMPFRVRGSALADPISGMTLNRSIVSPEM